MVDFSMIFGAGSYTIASLAFFVFTCVLAVSWRGALQGALMTIACLGTSAWAGANAFAYWTNWTDATSIQVIVLLELFRDLAWITALWGLLKGPGPRRSGFSKPRLVLGLALLAFVGLAALELWLGLGVDDSIPEMVLVVSLALAITGVMLTETLYRSGSPDERWRYKFLCFAIGGVFAFNMFLNADAILLSRIDPSLQQAKGAVHVLVVPLLAIGIRRNGLWRTDLSLSHDVVLHSTAFIFGGVYLFLMAVVGYYLRGLGPEWGSIAQVTFMFGAVVLLAVVLLSGTSRAYLRVFLAKHFFKERYDYREAWHGFIQTLSEGLTTTSLEERAILAAANIVDSPGGAIWLRDGDHFTLSSVRNLATDDFHEPEDGSLVRFLARTQWVVVIEEAKADPAAYPDLVLPDALLRVRRGWVVIPLWHYELIGFMLLAEPRAPRKLVWEDFDLLKTAGRQIASYMAEQHAERALTEAREFEEFNRRYAFVIHDIKNIVSQLSLVATNFRKYSSDPEFLEDMIQTVDEAVGKMNRITDKISERQRLISSRPAIALGPLIERIVSAKQISGATVTASVPPTDILVAADEDRLEAVIGHLVQNALEATEFRGKVGVSLHGQDNNAVIEVTDDGPGMEAEFIRKHLFKPFRSTKGKGFGIGAYQCRAYARELGGRLDVDSMPGKGTTMRMRLPQFEPETATAPVVPASESVQ